MATKWATGIWKARALPVDAVGTDGEKRHAWGKSGNANNPQVGIVVNVQQPRGTKREGVVYLTLTPEAAEFAMQRMRIMGWQGTDLRDLRGIDRNYFDVDVSYENFDGKERLRLEVLTPAKAQHKAELSDAELGALALQYSDHASRAPEITTVTPKNAKPGGAPPASEDFGGFDAEEAS